MMMAAPRKVDGGPRLTHRCGREPLGPHTALRGPPQPQHPPVYNTVAKRKPEPKLAFHDTTSLSYLQCDNIVCYHLRLYVLLSSWCWRSCDVTKATLPSSKDLVSHSVFNV
ncbi:hypothetical protein OTU49_013373 [Cherax quadricarinatus]|uniref:Uncharacterized protein n=1 Tax=Cherax quadricarinatus TaxID=27406 RepID=A0AAW0VTC1_CHEQU